MQQTLRPASDATSAHRPTYLLYLSRPGTAEFNMANRYYTPVLNSKCSYYSSTSCQRRDFCPSNSECSYYSSTSCCQTLRSASERRDFCPSAALHSCSSSQVSSQVSSSRAAALHSQLQLDAVFKQAGPHTTGWCSCLRWFGTSAAPGPVCSSLHCLQQH